MAQVHKDICTAILIAALFETKCRNNQMFFNREMVKLWCNTVQHLKWSRSALGCHEKITGKPYQVKNKIGEQDVCCDPIFDKQCFLNVSIMLLLLLSYFSPVWLYATPQMAAHQAPLCLGFSRQEHWSGLPFPPPVSITYVYITWSSISVSFSLSVFLSHTHAHIHP